MKIHDAYMRPLDNLRVVVTVECNYRCIFCHIEGESVEGPVKPGSLTPLLTPEDYYIVARAAEIIGISKIKFTGGEPLIRRDILDIIKAFREGAPTLELSMTTNGYLLEKLASKLSENGLARVNVSIHSLRSEVYKFITGVDGLQRAIAGLRKASDAGLGLKINMVVLKGVNEHEIWDLLDLAHRLDATLQLIELHPVGLGARFFNKYYYPLAEIEKKLLEVGAKVVRRSLHNRPVYILPSGERVEIVKPYGNPIFCMGCQRIRLGPFGDLWPCLNWKGPRPNMLPGIRKGSIEDRIISAIETFLRVNMLRRPYFLPGIRDGKHSESLERSIKLSRLQPPKKRIYERYLEELRRQLQYKGTQ